MVVVVVVLAVDVIDPAVVVVVAVLIVEAVTETLVARVAVEVVVMLVKVAVVAVVAESCSFCQTIITNQTIRTFTLMNIATIRALHDRAEYRKDLIKKLQNDLKVKIQSHEYTVDARYLDYSTIHYLELSFSRSFSSVPSLIDCNNNMGGG